LPAPDTTIGPQNGCVASSAQATASVRLQSSCSSKVHPHHSDCTHTNHTSNILLHNRGVGSTPSRRQP
jgi:hypothetical protein